MLLTKRYFFHPDYKSFGSVTQGQFLSVILETQTVNLYPGKHGMRCSSKIPFQMNTCLTVNL